MAEPGKKNRYVWHVLRVAIAAGALYLVFRGEDFGEITQALLAAGWPVFCAGVSAYILSQLIFVTRWCLLLRVQSIRIGYLTAFKLHLIGLFYNNCLPSSLGGDVLRAWYVTRHTDRKLEAALSVFVDRVIGMTGLMIMAFACYWFVPAADRAELLRMDLASGGAAGRLWHYRWAAAAACAAAAVLLAGAIWTRTGRGATKRILGLVGRGAMETAAKISESVRLYRAKWPALAVALVLTFCCQAVFVTGLVVVGKSAGIPSPVKYYFIFFPLSWFIGALPLSIGGLGIMEGWLKLAFGRVAGVSPQQALVLGLFQRLIWLVGSIPGAVIHLMGLHHRRELV
jgi:uncharacterized membrane protein YbhN (UPF0104 family)